MKRHAALSSDDWLRDVYAMWLPSEVWVEASIAHPDLETHAGEQGSGE